jgi:hypothetical protein
VVARGGAAGLVELGAVQAADAHGRLDEFAGGELAEVEAEGRGVAVMDVHDFRVERVRGDRRGHRTSRRTVVGSGDLSSSAARTARC